MFNRNSFKQFSNKDESEKWGTEHYNDWMVELQNQSYDPQTPAEKFFRYYTQGINHVYNRILRHFNINTYDFKDSFVSKEMFLDGISEIEKHPVCEDIIVHRYVHKDILHNMKNWSNVKVIKPNSILTDKGFFSTTLSLDSVIGRGYATPIHHSLFYIYVPKGTPCVYLDLISEMYENEMLFAPDVKLKVLNRDLLCKFIECVIVND